MALQEKTRQIIESAVSKREKFDRGNVWGEWKSPHFFTGKIGWLPSEFADILKRHSKNSRLFVLYSFHTPMAWYSEAEQKWYYVDHRYSVRTSQHQHAYRYALRGQNVVTLTSDENGNVTESEQEFYSDKK